MGVGGPACDTPLLTPPTIPPGPAAAPGIPGMPGPPLPGPPGAPAPASAVGKAGEAPAAGPWPATSPGASGMELLLTPPVTPVAGDCACGAAGELLLTPPVTTDPGGEARPGGKPGVAAPGAVPAAVGGAPTIPALESVGGGVGVCEPGIFQGAIGLCASAPAAWFWTMPAMAAAPTPGTVAMPCIACAAAAWPRVAAWAGPPGRAAAAFAANCWTPATGWAPTTGCWPGTVGWAPTTAPGTWDAIAAAAPLPPWAVGAPGVPCLLRPCRNC
mmetsp:Transcript_73867/g.229073  ORF Transcript_73867/g.229073 Transcript_73867/m.229073 type:complete len:272 (+) Transcript_73867:788-1603(+)